MKDWDELPFGVDGKHSESFGSKIKLGGGEQLTGPGFDLLFTGFLGFTEANF